MTHIIDDCSGCWMPQALESALADNAALREQLVAARAKTQDELAEAEVTLTSARRATELAEIVLERGE